MRFWSVVLTFSVFCSGCSRDSHTLAPQIVYTPSPWQVEKLYGTGSRTPFSHLSKEEHLEEWGRELYLGRKFGQDSDFYRALTCFKRSLFLINESSPLSDRLFEIEYEIFLTYYLAGKYQEAVEAFEMSHLASAPPTFPAFNNLAIALYDAYIHLGLDERAGRILNFIYTADPEKGEKLALGTVILNADLEKIDEFTCQDGENGEIAADFLCSYYLEAKSVSKAQALNAVIPGAGYLYVGQQKTALTSLIINTLFIAAAWQLFDRGYVAPALIVSSLEVGWYFGGINGAGLAAKEYNERLYERVGKETLIENKLFPILTFQMSF